MHANHIYVLFYTKFIPNNILRVKKICIFIKPWLQKQYFHFFIFAVVISSVTSYCFFIKAYLLVLHWNSNRMALFYFREKPKTKCHGSKNMKKRMFKWKYLMKFLRKWKILKHIWKRKKMSFKSSRQDVFCKKGVLRNFLKFTRKHLR